MRNFVSKFVLDISFIVFEIPFDWDYDLYQMYKSYLYKGNFENAKGNIRQNFESDFRENDSVTSPEIVTESNIEGGCAPA